MNRSLKLIQLSLVFTCLAAISSFSFSYTVELPVEEGFVDINTGQTLHYIAQGEQGKKPLLLFIHGAPERAEVWKDYMSYLSINYFTVAYTTRGYYPSSIPQAVEEYSVNTLAADALAVAQAFGYDTFTIVGHDWGAATAWRAAINYPNAVERLIVLSNPHPLMYARAYHESDAHRALIDAYIPLARDSIAPWTREATLANNLDHFKSYVYSDESGVKDDIDWSLGNLFEQTWRYDEGETLDAIYNHYKALDWPLTTLATCNPLPNFSLTVKQPVLAVYGLKDRFVSPEAFTLPNNDCTPNTWYIPLEDVGHFPHHQNKSYLKRKMMFFLNQTEK